MRRLATIVGFSIVGGAFSWLGACGTDLAIPSIPNVDAGDAGTPSNGKSYAVGGSVAGLLGTGLVLQNNGGDDIAVNANGTFVFPNKVESGKPFAVTVKAQPSAPAQTCTVSAGSGTIATADVSSVVVNCTGGGFTVGGTVTGLAGSGLVLQINGGNDLVVNANGSFAFSKPLLDAATFVVTLKTQPTNVSQTCTLTNATGAIANANVTNVGVTCVTNKYTVGGTVTGLTGSGLVLTNNGGGDLAINADGTFTFAGNQDDGSDFKVEVKTSPTNPNQNCVVSGGSGKLAGGNVSSITVNCSIATYAIGGTVSGLEGTGLVLTNNGGDNLTINSNGTFAFATPIADLAGYQVDVASNPTNKWQTCTVSNGSGNVAGLSVSSVDIVCTTNQYPIKVVVSGLEGDGLVLQNNGGDDLKISSNNNVWSFNSSVPSGGSYLISVLTQPTNKSQTCTPTPSSGVAAGDTVGINLVCVTNKYTIGGKVSGLAGGNEVVLQNNGGDDITVKADGTFTFPAGIESGKSFDVTVKTNPSTPSQTCTVSAGSGNVVAGNIESVAVNCAVDTFTVSGTITGYTGTALKLANNGEIITVNGTSFSFTAQADETAYAVSVDTQPVSPWQTCTVSNGSGTLAGANVNSVTVDCTTNAYAVGGSVTGLTGDIVVTNNGGDDTTVSGSGPFTLKTKVASGDAYAIAVKSAPPGLYCVANQATGTVTNAAVSDVVITCTTCGNDCWGADGCATAGGKCIKFTCRAGTAPQNFCETCTGWKDVTLDDWLNQGYCGDIIARYRVSNGSETKCGGSVSQCCGSSGACGGGDNAWHFPDGTGTHFTGPTLGNYGGDSQTNCTFWNFTESSSYTRITACIKK